MVLQDVHAVRVRHVVEQLEGLRQGLALAVDGVAIGDGRRSFLNSDAEEKKIKTIGEIKRPVLSLWYQQDYWRNYDDLKRACRIFWLFSLRVYASDEVDGNAKYSRVICLFISYSFMRCLIHLKLMSQEGASSDAIPLSPILQNFPFYLFFKHI